MRKALGLLLVLPFLAQAKVEDRPVVTPQILGERWVKAWSQPGGGAPEEQQLQRGTLLRLLHNHLTTADGAHGLILIRELPNSEFTDAVCDLIKMNSGTMNGLTLDQFLMVLALEGDLVYSRGYNLSESGVTLEAMKEALKAYLQGFQATELATTVLQVKLEDLRLASTASPEFKLIFTHLIPTLKKMKILNFRVVVTMSPKAFEYVFDYDELLSPLYKLEDDDSLQVIDGSKLEFGMSCASLMEPHH